MLNPSEVISHFANMEAAALKFAEDADARITSALELVERLKAEAEVAHQHIISVRDAQASVAAAAAIVPSLADVKALLDHVM